MSEWMTVMMSGTLSPEFISGSIAFITVILTDIVMAGENAVVIGIISQTLPKEMRRRALIYGMIMAGIMRIVFSVVAVYLLNIPGLQFVGGVMLLWVAYKLLREFRAKKHQNPQDHHKTSNASAKTSDEKIKAKGLKAKVLNRTQLLLTKKSAFKNAMIQIAIADVTLSLDNILAVAGVAKDHLFVLVFGLILSVALLGIGANLVGKLIEKYSFIAYVAIILIVGISLKMFWNSKADFNYFYGLIL